jgi:predicted ribosomally synthesized peptide with nif11-like leader
MSIENAVSFRQKVGRDQQLQSRIKPHTAKIPKNAGELRPETFQELSKIAKELGFDASPQEFVAAESVIQFWERVENDRGLEASVKAAQTGTAAQSAEAIVKVAQRAGYGFTVNDLTAVGKALQGTPSVASGAEIDDKQLEKVAGGVYWRPYKLSPWDTTLR